MVNDVGRGHTDMRLTWPKGIPESRLELTSIIATGNTVGSTTIFLWNPFLYIKKKFFYLQNKIFHWRCKVLKISEFLKSDYYTIFQGLLGWTYSVNVTYAKGLNTSSGNLRGSHLISTNWYNLLHVIQINYIHTIIWTEWLLINNKADTKLLIFK